MRKILLVMIVITLSFALAACGDEKAVMPGIIDDAVMPELNDITPNQSFGNQTNSAGGFFVVDEEEIYAVDSDAAGHDCIVRFGIGDPYNQETVYKEKEGLRDVSILDDWVYFVKGGQNENGVLYRIKKDESECEEVLDNVWQYTLTDKEIYYSIGGNQIYAASLDGMKNRTIAEENYRLIGIDNGWLYCFEAKNDEEDYLCRIRPDGSEIERVFGLQWLKDNDRTFGMFIINDSEAFYSIDADFKSEKAILAKKTLGGKEEVLSTGTLITSLNIESDWLFYSDENSIYKIDVTGNDKNQLVHSFKEWLPDGSAAYVSSILLSSGDALITYSNDKSVYIKKDGTIIELGKNQNQHE